MNAALPQQRLGAAADEVCAVKVHVAVLQGAYTQVLSGTSYSLTDHASQAVHEPAVTNFRRSGSPAGKALCHAPCSISRSGGSVFVACAIRWYT